METLLSISSFNSLLSYVNVILVGIIISTTINRFKYKINVVVYAISKTIIPILTSWMFESIITANISFDFRIIIMSLIFYFILGTVVIKITNKVSDCFNSDTVGYFIISFAIIDIIVSKIVAFVLVLLN